MWNVEIDRDALKQLKRIPKKERERLREVIHLFARDPFTGDIEKLKGEENIWRRRVGNYRIKYEILKDERVVYVFDVERRTSKTY